MAAARVTAGEEIHRRLVPILSPDRCAQLDALLAADPALGVAPLVWLGGGATTTSPESVKAEVAKLAHLRTLDADRPTSTWSASDAAASAMSSPTVRTRSGFGTASGTAIASLISTSYSRHLRGLPPGMTTGAAEWRERRTRVRCRPRCGISPTRRRRTVPVRCRRGRGTPECTIRPNP